MGEYNPADYYRRELERESWRLFDPNSGGIGAIYVPIAKPKRPAASSQKFSYAETAAVPARTRAAAELAFALVSRDLGLEAMSLRFFEVVAPSWHRGPIVHADERRLMGWVWAKPDGPQEIWVEAGLEPAEAAGVVAHECRHLEQYATFGPCRTEKVRAARDRDAEAYAEEFTARYLPAGRHGISDEIREGTFEPESSGTPSALWRHLSFLRGSRRVGGLIQHPLPSDPREPWLSTIGA